MTLQDPMPSLRGSYISAAGAARALKRYSGGGLPEAATKIADSLCAPEIPVLQASRGDCVIADLPGFTMPALGLVAMNGRHALFAAPIGLTSIPLGNCSRAWRV